MPQTSSAVTAGNDILASDINKIITDLAEIYSGGPGVPIGGVIYFWSDNTMPINYKECNGQVISDAASPLNGKTTPNAVNKFLRGIANANIRTSIPTGGADAISLAHAHTVANHTHTQRNHKHASGGQTGVGIARGGADWVYNFANSQGPREHYHDTPRTNWVDEIDGGTWETGGSAPATTSSLGSYDIIPSYVGLVPIVRYK